MSKKIQTYVQRALDLILRTGCLGILTLFIFFIAMVLLITAATFAQSQGVPAASLSAFVIPTAIPPTRTPIRPTPLPDPLKDYLVQQNKQDSDFLGGLFTIIVVSVVIVCGPIFLINYSTRKSPPTTPTRTRHTSSNHAWDNRMDHPDRDQDRSYGGDYNQSDHHHHGPADYDSSSTDYDYPDPPDSDRA